MTNRREITPARSPQKHAGARTKRGHGAKPEAVRERAVLALLHERTVAEAAKTAGVDESTVRRWLADDDAFKAHYAAARKTAFEAGMSRVQALTGKAIETLDDLLDATNHPNVRLGAARTVAEIAIPQNDESIILARLDELDRARQPRF